MDKSREEKRIVSHLCLFPGQELETHEAINFDRGCLNTTVPKGYYLIYDNAVKRGIQLWESEAAARQL
jgi:hypothetical protein